MGTKPTADFKQEAVRVALTSRLSRKQAASDFEIGFSTLSRWIKEERLRKEVRMLRGEHPCWSSGFFCPYPIIS